MIGEAFVDRYYSLSKKKDSFLCVGLDPAVAGIRKKYIVPPELTEKNISKGVKNFCINIIRSVGPFTPIIKPNAQFLLYLLSYKDIVEIVETIHDVDCLALLDIKLSDVGSTMDAALFWINELGFDAVTFSPFPGYKNGVDAIYRWAELNEKGIFVLCRMSNPGTHDYQSKKIEGVPFYEAIASDSYKKGCNGFVVGSTASEELEVIRNIIGKKSLILSPGLGPQGGDPRKALLMGANENGEGLIVSSSRSINYAYEIYGVHWAEYAEAAGQAAEERRRTLNEIKEEIFSSNMF
jgi:orotidine-5'-phosphate decarboxylase